MKDKLIFIKLTGRFSTDSRNITREIQVALNHVISHTDHSEYGKISIRLTNIEESFITNKQTFLSKLQDHTTVL